VNESRYSLGESGREARITFIFDDMPPDSAEQGGRAYTGKDSCLGIEDDHNGLFDVARWHSEV